MSIPYTLVRSNRHTLALVVDASGALVARAPQRMPLRDIEAFIAGKQRWIAEKQAMAQKRAAQRPACSLADGQTLPFLGETLLVRRVEVPTAMAFHGVLLLPRNIPAEASLQAWLLSQAQLRLPPLVASKAAQLGLSPSSLHFSAARSRWGSMNSRRQMRLNLALLLCPLPVVEYVIVHELAHIPHPNHSAAFWSLVAQWLPDSPQRRAWLKQNNHLIGFLYGP